MHIYYCTLHGNKNPPIKFSIMLNLNKYHIKSKIRLYSILTIFLVLIYLDIANIYQSTFLKDFIHSYSKIFSSNKYGKRILFNLFLRTRSKKK